MQNRNPFGCSYDKETLLVELSIKSYQNGGKRVTCKQEKSSNGSMSGGLNVHGMSLMTDHADALTVYAAADTLNICSPKLGLHLHYCIEE